MEGVLQNGKIAKRVPLNVRGGQAAAERSMPRGGTVNNGRTAPLPPRLHNEEITPRRRTGLTQGKAAASASAPHAEKGSTRVPNYRKICVGVGIVFVAAAVILAVCIFQSLFGVPKNGASSAGGPVGSFFVGSCGIFAMLVPCFLAAAALILAHPGYNPRAVFYLDAAIVPFVTLCTGFNYIRHYAYYAGL
jgi:hypothetical protein